MRQRAPGESCQVTASRGSAPDVEIPSFHERSGSLNTELSPLYLSLIICKGVSLARSQLPPSLRLSLNSSKDVELQSPLGLPELPSCDSVSQFLPAARVLFFFSKLLSTVASFGLPVWPAPFIIFSRL